MMADAFAALSIWIRDAFAMLARVTPQDAIAVLVVVISFALAWAVRRPL